MTAGFVHLHVHSEYSLLDGAARIKDLIDRAASFGMPALALTDHGAMYGMLDFFSLAKKKGIKPILGCEVYVAPRTRFDREAKIDDRLCHLILLAENNIGLQNLMKVVSVAALEGFYYKPRVDKQLLREHSEGLIALSACIGGEVPQAILAGRTDRAAELCDEYVEIFGKDNFFIELQNQGIPEEEQINPGLIRLSKEKGIPLVVTNDIHYTAKEDAEVQDILLCVQMNKTVDDPDRMSFSTKEFYMKSEAEMRSLFPELQEAYDNTVKIADRCNVDIDLTQQYLPKYPLPEGFTTESYLEHLCMEKLVGRYPDSDNVVTERLNYELGVIERMGYSAYFLIVWDFINYARENGIFVGPGRGSAAGSIVAYILGITNIDPMKYGLLFERFLNPERVSMPDIDIDFCFERRQEVIDYVVKRYGEDRVAQIITFGTMAAKGSIRDAGRALNIPLSDVMRITKMIPEELNITLADSIEKSADLRQAMKDDSRIERLIKVARGLEGIPRNCSTHAAGIVIASDELTRFVPVQRVSGGDMICTQLSWGNVEKIGLLKMDFLGLRTLTMIGKSLELIKETYGIVLKPEEIPLDERKTYDLLTRGDTTGVFQLESSGMRGILKELRPDRFEDVVALVALYRPGPLGSGMVDDFIRGKHGGEIKSLHPLIDHLLAETYGVILYQEQVMLIAVALSGFSMGQADVLRKAMGKKNPELVAQQKDSFVSGAVKNGVDAKKAEEIFDLIAYFAGYGFNKSHSAAYAVLSVQTAYLKAHYPVEFIAAVLTSYLGNNEKIAQNIMNAREAGVEVLAPHINSSRSGFSVEDNKIRFGLAAVKNVGIGVIEEIITIRNEKGAFKSFADFCERLSSQQLNKRLLESLIKAGAFDCYGETRATLLLNMEDVLSQTSAMKKGREKGQISLFDVCEDLTGAEICMHKYPELASDKIYSMEKDVLGFYLSGHPLYDVMAKMKNIKCASKLDIAEMSDGALVNFCGMIVNQRTLLTKKGDQMAFLTMEDLIGTIDIVVFPRTYEKYRELFITDRPLVVEAKVDAKDDVPKLLAQGFRTVSEVCGVHLHFNGRDSGSGMLDEIKTLLSRNLGCNPVYLHLDDLGKTILADKRYWFSMDAHALASLRQMQGLNVEIKECEEVRLT